MELLPGKANSTCACTWQEPRRLRGHKSAQARLAVMQKKEETPQPVTPCREGKVARLKGHAPTHSFPWRQVEQGMVSPGWNRLRPVPRKNGGETDLQSIAGHRLGDGKFGLPIPSRSRIVRGRHEAVQQLYWHAGERTPACHDVAAQGMASHHPDTESGVAKSLNNQVLCMISEYHLTSLSQGSSFISPVLPEAVKDLLPPIEEYMADSGFQGTRDLRVLEKARTLQVAVCLHHLDMATAGDGMASYSLDAAWHSRGPLLEFLLAPQASSLTFEEVIHQVLAENRYKVESSLDNIQELRARLRGELEDLYRAHKDEPEKSSQKKLKREIERRWKDLKGLEATISQYQRSLGGAQARPDDAPASDDDKSDSGAEGAMTTIPVADDAPPVSAAPEPLTCPPGEEQTCSMEVDDGDDCQPPASPVSHREDKLLTGGDAVGVEGEMANLTVSSPGGYDGSDEGTSV